MTTIRTRLVQNEKKILKENTIVIAIKLLNMGLNKEQIQQATELSNKDLDKIINKIKMIS